MKKTLITTRQLVIASGATYRQLDYWTRQKVIPCYTEPTPGSGHIRHFEDDGTLVKKIALLSMISKAFYGNPTGDILKRIFDNYDLGFVMLTDDISINWEVK